MTRKICKQHLISVQNHLTLDLINFEFQKLADATAGCHRHLISNVIVKYSKYENLTYARILEIFKVYDDFLIKLFDDFFKRRHKSLVNDVLININNIITEFDQRMLSAANESDANGEWV